MNSKKPLNLVAEDIESTTDELLCSLEPSDHVQGLELESCAKITNEGLAALAGKFPNLQLLNLCGCKQISLRGLCSLIDTCPKIRFLTLSYCPKFQDYAVKEIMERCPALEELNVEGWTQLTDKGLVWLEKYKGPSLFLDLSSCRKLTEDGLKGILDRCPRLRGLTVEGHLFSFPFSCEPLAPALEFLKINCSLSLLDFEKLLKKCSNLTTLSFQGIVFDTRNISMTGSYPSVTWLRVYCATGPQLLVFSKLFPNLKSLYFHARGFWDDLFIEVVHFVPFLEYLNLSKCEHLTDLSYRELAASCTDLRYLELWYCQRMTEEGLGAILESCVHLEELFLEVAKQLNRQDLQLLCTPSQSLRKFTFRYCTRLSDQALTSLTNALPNLETLELTNCEQIGDDGLSGILRNCPRLRSLMLTSCKVALSDIEKRHSHIRFLYLETSVLLNKSVKNLYEIFPNLEVLNFGSTRGVKKEDLQFLLEQSKHLCEVYVQTSRELTPTGFRELQSNFPNIMLKHY